MARSGEITAPWGVPSSDGAHGLALYLLVTDGEPGTEIYSAATSRDQARIVSDEARRMTPWSPALRRRVLPLINNLHVPDSAVTRVPRLGAIMAAYDEPRRD